jgi:hypothetical protein
VNACGTFLGNRVWETIDIIEVTVNHQLTIPAHVHHDLLVVSVLSKSRR